MAAKSLVGDCVTVLGTHTLNGRFEVMSPVGVGTTVRAEIPRTAQTVHTESASVDWR